MTTRTPWPARHRRGGAHRQLARRRGFHGREQRGAQEVLARRNAHGGGRHTNAFKINEDVVIPLPRMAEYTDGIERINIELMRNKLALCDALQDFLARGDLP